MELTKCNKHFMLPNTNYQNMKKLIKLADYFPLEGISNRRFKSHIKQTIKGCGLSQEFNHSLQFFGFGKDLREWYKLEHNTTGIDDKNFIKYQKKIFSYWMLFPKGISPKVIGEMLTYNNYKKNSIKVKGQTLKLFKFIKSKKLLPDTEMEEITRCKDNSEQLYLCISKNPIDILMASTNQSFSSCISLNSDFGRAFYTGLPNEMINPNKCIAFLTKGKLNKYDLQDNITIKHFRYIARSWIILNEDLTLGQVRSYPSREKGDFDFLLGEAGYPIWPIRNQEAQRKFLLSRTPITSSLKETASKYWFEPLLDWSSAKPLTIYNDWGIERRSTNSKKRPNNKKWTGKSLIRDTTNGICYLNSLVAYSYEEGFVKLPKNHNDKMKLLQNEAVFCDNCGKVEDKNEIKTINGEKYCKECADTLYTECNICKNQTKKENIKPGMDLTDSRGNIHKGKSICMNCFYKYFKTCTHCGTKTDTPQQVTVTISEKGTSIKLYCKNCLEEQIEQKSIQYCDHCGCEAVSTEVEKVKGKRYCKDCRSKRIKNCNNCGKDFNRFNENYVMDHEKNYICEECKKDFVNCPSCANYFKLEKTNQ